MSTGQRIILDQLNNNTPSTPSTTSTPSSPPKIRQRTNANRQRHVGGPARNLLPAFNAIDYAAASQVEEKKNSNPVTEMSEDMTRIKLK